MFVNQVKCFKNYIKCIKTCCHSNRLLDELKQLVRKNLQERQNPVKQSEYWFSINSNTLFVFQVFHTRNKQGVVIHPTSVFASDPEVLHVPEDDGREAGDPRSEAERCSSVDDYRDLLFGFLFPPCRTWSEGQQQTPAVGLRHSAGDQQALLVQLRSGSGPAGPYQVLIWPRF